jgi:hypothetical protein
MLARGDRQHDIAAWFGVNGGRIAEIATEAKFGFVPMQVDKLPPAGPYLSGRGVQKARDQLVAARATLNQLSVELGEMIQELDKG